MFPYQDNFFEYLENRNYSQETIYNYKRDLKVFSIFLEVSGLSFLDISKQTIEFYKKYLTSEERNLSISSINRTLTGLRCYLNYLIEINQEPPISPLSIQLFKPLKKEPIVTEFSQMIKLIESPTTFEKNKVVALRNRACLETLFASGMRISELIGLKRTQIDKSGRIFVTGKGKKQRFIYLTDRAKKHIDDYLAKRVDDSPFLFVANNRGKNAGKKDKHISPNYIQMKMKKYRELLGMNIPTSPHSLRHGYATYLAEEGANPVAIQILLGHESLDTTTRYVHASDKYAETTHKKFHPLKD